MSQSSAGTGSPEPAHREHKRTAPPPTQTNKRSRHSPQKDALISDKSHASAGTTTSGWEKGQNVLVTLHRLPIETRTEHLWEWFAAEGTIVWMEIFDSRNPVETGPLSARIRFQPPPKRAFWSRGTYVVNHSNRQLFPRGLSISISASPNLHPQCARSTHDPQQVYPLEMRLPLKSLDFGVQTRDDCMKVMKTVLPCQGHPLALDLNVRNKTMSAQFSLPGRFRDWVGISDFKFQFRLKQLKAVYQTKSVDSSYSLLLSLPLPPEYFRREEARSTVSNDLKDWKIEDTWYRATDVAENIQASQRYPIALNNDIDDPEHMEIGRWTTFRFVVDNSTAEAATQVQQLRLALEDHNIACNSWPGFEISQGVKPIVWSLLDHPSISPALGGNLALLQSTSRVIHLDFAVRYQLEACLSRGVLNEQTITEDFLVKLSEMPPIKARLRLEYVMDRNEKIYNPIFIFADSGAEAFYPIVKLPHYCALVRKVIITPTTVRLNLPTPETSNRVIRKYSEYQDRFLRVQFLEESEKDKIGTFSPQNDALYCRIVRAMYQGIQIGDRHYEFLAFGNSQLRECGAYFFSPPNGLSCDDIRNWMGHFSHIKVVAKYAARLGQCFSTTREIKGIRVPSIREVPDIERNGYCFSDGVGIISPFLADIIRQEMEMDSWDGELSAFQFRMGGCKGVFVVWPQAKGMEVHIRQSQEKFKSVFNGLEIIKCAKFATATLNRQTIVILESLGVRPEAFHDLLDYQLSQYEKATKDKSLAIDLLSRFVDENQTTLVIAALLKADFVGEGVNEPFVTSILNLWKAWSLKLLKEKSRLHIEQSAFVLGCVDETGSLRGHTFDSEGTSSKETEKLPQIFLQISGPSKGYRKSHIIKGLCIVGRNPSLHPGDIRVVEAVDEPKLHHLKNVVVFPSTGDRPVPNMLSGGDLDGDDFFIVWDQSLIPSRWNFPAMNYTGSKPIVLDRDVTVDDMKNFFISYVKNNVLPFVATAHLGWADAKGPMNKICLDIANMHSHAVDFPKTGDPVIWDRKYEPKQWPHFQEKRKTYRSDKVLGQIYNKVSRCATGFDPDWVDEFDQRVLKRFELSHEMLKAAREIKTQYDTSVRRILAQHNVATEFELWTTFAMSSPAAGTHYKRQEDLGKEYETLKLRFREMCYAAAGGKSNENLDPFVAAMYKVTEEQIKIALFEHDQGPINDGGEIRGPRPLEPRSMPLISFPWIFPWAMIRIAQGGKSSTKELAANKRSTQKGAFSGLKMQSNVASTEDCGTSGVNDGVPSEALSIAARGDSTRHQHPESEDVTIHKVGHQDQQDDCDSLVSADAGLVDQAISTDCQQEDMHLGPSELDTALLPATSGSDITGTNCGEGSAEQGYSMEDAQDTHEPAYAQASEQETVQGLVNVAEIRADISASPFSSDATEDQSEAQGCEESASEPFSDPETDDLDDETDDLYEHVAALTVAWD